MRTIKNVNVAVIGGLGFLGSHLVKHLIEDRNCNVIVLDNLITGTMEMLHPKAKFIYCDITHSEAQLRKIFEQNKIEYIFNYAAEPYIPVSFERPLHVFDINARGALMVMNAGQDAGVKGILQVSSAEIYGDAPSHPINEEYPARPHSTYGASKLAIDALVQARWRESKTPVIALRQFNCVGENDLFHPYVIPEIINQLRNSNIVYLGNNSFRDFQYAGDAVKMATELLEKGQFGEVYNMGSEVGANIYDIAHAVGEIMGKEIEVKQDPERCRPWEIWHLQSDNTKLYSVIERRPEVSFMEALERTVKDICSKN
jgi:UDP-glucose 4-epimerase